MTNEKMLREIIDSKGIKLKFIASKLGITYQGFLAKLQNVHDFRQGEIKIITEVLGLTNRQRDDIFFG